MIVGCGAEAPVTIRFGYAELLSLYGPDRASLLSLIRDSTPNPVTSAVLRDPSRRAPVTNRAWDALGAAPDGDRGTGAPVTNAVSVVELLSLIEPATAKVRSINPFETPKLGFRTGLARFAAPSSCH